MRNQGTKRLALGIGLMVLTFIAYSTYVAPLVRAYDPSTFMGAMARATPDGRGAAAFVSMLRLIAWGLGLGGAGLAFWGWQARRASKETPAKHVPSSGIA
jgi:hypothetical protein